MMRSLFVSALFASSASAIKQEVGVHQQSHAELVAGVEAHAEALARLFSGSILRHKLEKGTQENNEKKERGHGGCSDEDRVRLSYMQTKMEAPMQLVMKQMTNVKMPSELGKLPENLPILQVPTDLDIDLAACDLREMIGVQGMRWKNIAECFAKGVKVSDGCAACPVSYMKATMGGDAITMPFSCVPKCTSSMMACGASKPGNHCLRSTVPCLKCLAPKVGKLESCLGADTNGEGMLKKVVELFKKTDLDDIGGLDTLFTNLMSMDGGNSTHIDLDPVLNFVKKNMFHENL